MPFSAKRILVTGGAGLIGSHLCERLVAAGHDIVCLDNFLSSSDGNMRRLIDNSRFTVLRHDITQPLYQDFDEIYNLACPAAPVYYPSAPVQVMKTTLLGAMNMLELATRVGAPVLQASTSEI